MVKKVLKVAVKGAQRSEEICEHVFERYVSPHVSRFAKDDEHVKRAAGLAYRFIPFFARFVVSKERFEQFVLNRVRFFVKPEVAT